MSLPKTLTPKLIKELNEACSAFRKARDKDCDCDDVGWCEACWIMAGGGLLLFDEDDDEDCDII